MKVNLETGLPEFTWDDFTLTIAESNELMEHEKQDSLYFEQLLARKTNALLHDWLKKQDETRRRLHAREDENEKG